MTEELRKCASVFDIDIFIYKDMEHGTCGEYMGSVNVVAKKHTNKLLNEWLDDKYSDISKVRCLICKPIKEDSYFNPVHYFWWCAAKIAREYHITIIY